MRRIIVSEGVSVDGIFDAETMGKWAAPYYSEEREEIVRGLVLDSDTLLLGRTTYDLQAWYWPNQKQDKYGIANHKNSMPKYVVTSKPLHIGPGVKPDLPCQFSRRSPRIGPLPSL